MHWRAASGHDKPRIEIANCSHCDEGSVWNLTLRTDTGDVVRDMMISSFTGEMIWPDTGIAVPPHPDMPADVLADYREAALVHSRSPRGSAAYSV